MRRGYLEEGSDAAGGDGVARVQKPPHTVVAPGRILNPMYMVKQKTSRKIWEFDNDRRLPDVAQWEMWSPN